MMNKQKICIKSALTAIVFYVLNIKLFVTIYYHRIYLLGIDIKKYKFILICK